MVKYTIKEQPELVIELPGKDSTKARQKAMEKLMELMDAGELETDLENGFGANDFIEVKDNTQTETGQDEDEIVQAVQLLNNLATLKLKMQESKDEALEIRTLVDLLFSEDPISESDVTRLKEGFKVLKTFAQANIRYRDARAQAESARVVLDRALQQPEAPAPKPTNGARSREKASTS
jgi:hypothetical protein